MKKGIKLAIVFLFPILAIAIGLEVMLRNIPNRFKQQAEIIKSDGANFETLILGSSHTQYGIDPNYLDSPALNLSNVSQTLDIDYHLLVEFEDSFPNLQTVVLRLSYATLFEILEESNESWRLKDYHIYLGSELGHLSNNLEILSVSLKRNLERIVEYYFAETRKSDNDLLDSKLEGQTNLEFAGKAVAIKHTIDNQKWLEKNLDNLNKIADWAKEKNLKIILVTLPGYKSYYSNMEKEQIKKTIEAGNQLDSLYSNLEYYNFLKDESFGAEDFYDGDHLNTIGARKFSRIINSLIEQ